MIEFVIFLVILALIFDFWNGANDAANSIATVVSTRVLSPRLAVVWAAFWNFVAAFGFGVGVATTVGKGIVQPYIVDEFLILGALIGAISWVVIATYSGLPISASHSLIGGLVGASIAKAGFESIILEGIMKVIAFMILAPLIGIVLGFLFMVLTLRFIRNSPLKSIDSVSRKMQLVSAALFSLGHGTNDAQKTMGVIAALLFSTVYKGIDFHIPIWVILSAHAAIALGTLAGGWRVVKTMGMRLTKLKPVGGFSAESSGATTLILTAVGGIPVSTTHTMAGAIIGVGATRRLSAVRWGVARKIVWAWILTIPITASISALSFYVVELLPFIYPA